jgi:hypothetical protein
MQLSFVLPLIGSCLVRLGGEYVKGHGGGGETRVFPATPSTVSQKGAVIRIHIPHVFSIPKYVLI